MTTHRPVRASVTANADLPLAVGPAIRTAPVSPSPSRIDFLSTTVTLVANPADPQVTDALAEDVRRAVGGVTVLWLAPGIACDIPLAEGADPNQAQTRLDARLQGIAVDGIVGSMEGRRKKLLIADMDSTMIEQECIDELAAEMRIKDKIAEITEAAMRGELDFEHALRERVALLKGLDTTVIQRVVTERISLTPGGRILIHTMKAHGAYCALVSGGFSVFTRKIARLLDFDEERANRLVVAGGKLTGYVADPVLGPDAKRFALYQLSYRFGLLRDQTMAVGDGANDLLMVEEAGLGVAFRAKPLLAEKADVRIDHGDLTALLYVQGYRQSEFVM